MEFTGFSDQALKFLRGLKRNNNREWFEKNRSLYENELLEPAKAFVLALAPRLYEISPEINAEPRVNGSIKRINRDTRFSADKTPYKDHFDFHFKQGGGGKDGPGYYLRIMPDQMWIGAGCYRFEKAPLARYRKAVAGRSGAELEKIVRSLARSKYTLGGSHYKRVPAGFAPDHERGGLLRHAGIYSIAEMKVPGDLGSAKFVGFCARRFERTEPLVSWIARHAMGEK